MAVAFFLIEDNAFSVTLANMMTMLPNKRNAQICSGISDGAGGGANSKIFGGAGNKI